MMKRLSRGRSIVSLSTSRTTVPRFCIARQPRSHRVVPRASETTPSYTWTTSATQSPPRKESTVGFQAQESIAQLTQIQQQDEIPSAEWLQSLYSTPVEQLPINNLSDLTTFLNSLAQTGCSLDAAWLQTLIQHHNRRITSSTANTRQLASFIWALSESNCELDPTALQPISSAVLAALQDFYAPDLASTLSALGDLGAQLDDQQKQQLLEEVTFQLRSFMADFAPLDLARLISGVADLQLQPGEEFRSWLMKAVYTHLRTIEDKGAVDFALAKLQAGDRSMHYDPRWTHEELSWLPRRERDKRRILKDGWFRTKWAGWAPGGQA